MGATDKERNWTDRPVSGRVPASTPVCIGTLLALASEAPSGATEGEVIERMLDVLVELEPRAAAALVVDDGDTIEIVHRASVELAEPDRALVDGRVFSELAEERSVPLGGPLSGSLHLGVPSFENASSEAYDVLLHQAACVFSLALRMLRGESDVREFHHEVAHLEKLATLGQTAASIVHELNNPLTAILAYSDFLERRLEARGAPQTDLDRLRHIGEAAARIQHFCRELTDYSRPSGRFHGPLDMHEVIDRALTFCMHGLRDADITVERIYRDVPMVVGIEAQLTQVFVNLITNAGQAMHPKGGTLRITTSYERGRVCIEVHDQGHGIPADVLPHIFDSFFTTKPRGQGVGLGLSIVRGIVNDHGGGIVARSGDSGTVFLVELPVGMADAPDLG